MTTPISINAAIAVNNPAAQTSPGYGFAQTGLQYSQANPFNVRDTVLVPANLSGTVTNATNASPIVITTSAPHNLVTNDNVTITGIVGNTAGNTTALVTVLSPTTFSLNGTTGNGAYVSGGTFTTANGIALPLGQVTTPHWAWFANLDPLNYVQLKNGQTGAVFARLLGGTPPEIALVPLDPTCTPWALANTSAIYLEYGILAL